MGQRSIRARTAGWRTTDQTFSQGTLRLITAMTNWRTNATPAPWRQPTQGLPLRALAVIRSVGILIVLWFAIHIPSVKGQIPSVNLPSNAVVAQPSTVPSSVTAGPSVGQRRVRVFPRSSVRWQARWFPSEDGREQIAMLDSGVNIIIDDVSGFGTVDISTDRIVIWTSADQVPALEPNAATTGDEPLEFYMEGNIVFRQQDRVIYAERMYYNVREEYGVVLDGEMLTPIPGYEGLVRLKADVLRQVDPFRIQGQSGAITTSRLGVPRYWLQSGDFVYEDLPEPGVSSVDPITGEPRVTSTKRVTSRSNRVYLAEIPVFAWPSLSANLERPSFYLESFRLNNDRVFGSQILTEWNLHQLLGHHTPARGTEWTLELDYLSKRGPAMGTNYTWDRDSVFHIPGPTFGFLHAWGIYDTGLDNLGKGRRAVPLETNNRGRILSRHRQFLHDGYQFTGEIGLVSDRNFLEQYYEEEWDEEKDQTTGVEFKKLTDNKSWSVTADVRVNDFFTQTNWWPRLDHFWIGQPILSDWLSWTEHTNVGYGKIQIADAPTNSKELAKFDPLAWEAEREGLRAVSRQRLDLPLQWGGAKIVPYALGEAGFWEQTLVDQDVTRLFGQLGVRASIPVVRINPNVSNRLFNVNGIAHKIVYESEFFWADADYELADMALYDRLDDDSTEFFRRRFFFDTFGGVPGGDIPLKFDERFYAARTGLQRWVTSPSSEVAKDLMIWRIAARQRWQTKRGMPGNQRVVDYIKLDIEGNIYPDPDRDNFGQEIGLLNYDFRWHAGDRFTVLSDGMADFFSSGLRTVSLAGMISRPGTYRFIGGVRSIEGPFSSSILYGSTSYRLSPKWIVNYATSLDFGKTGNIGQRGQFVRVGESFLVGLGFNYDRSRDNFGVQFSVEPRFLAGRLGRVGNVPILPVGYNGLE